MLALDAIWWWLLARLLARQHWRIALGTFMGAQIIGLIWLISSRLLRADWDRWLPKFAVSAVFIWHFIVLGLLVLIGAALVPISASPASRSASSITSASAVSFCPSAISRPISTESRSRT